jgi:hypothetical protein
VSLGEATRAGFGFFALKYINAPRSRGVRPAPQGSGSRRTATVRLHLAAAPRLSSREGQSVKLYGQFERTEGNRFDASYEARLGIKVCW